MLFDNIPGLGIPPIFFLITLPLLGILIGVLLKMPVDQIVQPENEKQPGLGKT